MGARICRQLGLNHESPELFFSPQYKMPISVYAIFRLCLFFYSLTIIVCNFIYKIDRTPWVYNTNWSYIILTINFLVKAIIAVERAFLYGCRRFDQSHMYGGRERMWWYLKLEWFLHNMAVGLPYMVAIGYWTGSWEDNRERNMANPMYMHLTIQLHGVNMLLGFLDHFFGATPTRLAHVYQPILFQMIYFSFSGVMYAVSDHGPIYPTLDWDKPSGAIIYMLVSVSETIACHLWVWLIKKLQLLSGCGCVVRASAGQLLPSTTDTRTPLLVSEPDVDIY